MADDFIFPEDRFLLLGKIAKPHGLRGEVKLHAYSDAPKTLLGYRRIVLVDDKGDLSPSLTIEKSRLQGKVAVFKLAGIDDRDGAEAIHGMGILLQKEDLVEVEEGEYYWHQFYTLPVRTKEGNMLGRVAGMFSNGAQDIMVVRDGQQEYLIPVLDSIVVEHDSNQIIIDPPPGLLDINAGTDE